MTYVNFFANGLTMVVNGFKSLRVNIDGYSFSAFALLFFVGLMMIFADMVREA